MELSEPATAVCLLFSERNLNSVKAEANTVDSGIKALQDWWLSDDWQHKLAAYNTGTGLAGSAKDHTDSQHGLDPRFFTGINSVNLTEIRKLDLINDASTKKATLKALSNVAVGISAALSIREWMKLAHQARYKPEKVYLTGGTWDPAIASFQVQQSGMKDYNSSDLVLYCGKRDGHKNGVYLGVSLKKKETPVSGHPTLINRSLVAALREVNNTKKAADGTVQWKPGGVGTTRRAAQWIKDIESERLGFFIKDIVKSRVKFSIDRKWLDGSQRSVQKHHFDKDGNSLQKNPKPAGSTMTFREALKYFEGIDIPKENDDEKLMRTKVEGALYSGKALGPRGKWKELINMKGTSGQFGPIRDLVNKRVASSENAYFNQMKKVLNSSGSTAIEMAEELTDHILKIELKKKLSKGNVLKFYYFGFGLCEAVAKVKKKGNGWTVVIGTAHTIDGDSILCALDKLARASRAGGRSLGYRFKLDEAKQSETFAGIKATIVKGVDERESKIINLDLRYKGDFTSKPDFQATIHPEFIATYLHGCPPGGH